MSAYHTIKKIGAQHCFERNTAFCNGTVAVIGDLNGRVGIETDFISGEAIDAQLQDKSYFINYVNDIEFQKSHFQDTKPPNNFGRRMLQLCMSTGLRICNGRVGQDSGTITFNNKNGCSTIDYQTVRIYRLKVYSMIQHFDQCQCFHL
jgi:hypothetical protein